MFTSFPCVASFDRANLCFLMIVILILHSSYSQSQYEPPKATVQALRPKGMRISVPDEEGISLVAFHVKFNEDFNGLEAGTIARDIVSVRNGRWTYEDRTTKLKKGDIVYYWVHVIYNGLGYNLLNQQYRVNVYYNYDGIPLNSKEKDSEKNSEKESVCSTPSETTWASGIYSSQKNSCPGQLLFEDNFDTLDSSKWTAVERFSGPPDYEFVVYQNSKDNIQVEDGQLHIIPTLLETKYGESFVRNGNLVLNKCTGQIGTQECQREALGSYILPPIISGRLNTKNSFNFLYGRIQVRAKLPRGDWLYPLITLESTENSDSGKITELRVAFTCGNAELKTTDGKDIGGQVLSAGGISSNFPEQRGDNIHVNQSELPKRESGSLWSNDFHVYELEWRRNSIIVKVDGVNYGQHNGGAPFDKPFYLNLGLAAGGYREFPDNSLSESYTKPWRNVGSKALFDFYEARNRWLTTWEGNSKNLRIDYVKVWAI